MLDVVSAVNSPQQLASTARRLRENALRRELTPSDVIEILERWGQALRDPVVDAIPGVAFLRLWLRRGTLAPIVERELGAGALQGDWRDERATRLRAFPLGVVGHWPAANIEIQPVLSLSCSLLGGNGCLVRVPTQLVQETRAVVERLRAVDAAETLMERISLATFDHARLDLQQAMAAAVDGAMIWGGAEAVSQIRALPFSHWARVLAFGPRISVAAMGGETWGRRENRKSWCQRIARDVWQFDQQACSSPQALFLERRDDRELDEFVAALADAFERENRAHPRRSIHPALTSAICLRRASWLMDDAAHRAVFPETPDWTILVGSGAEIPQVTQGRVLNVMVVDDLHEAIAKFDGMVQTLGLAVDDSAKEATLAQSAGENGVDRIVKLGRMHVFGSPWDGADLIRPMVRLVRHVPSQDA